MNDQADTLRRLMQDFEEKNHFALDRIAGPVVTIASPEASPERGWIAAHLAVLYARKGLRVLLADEGADLEDFSGILGNEPNLLLSRLPVSEQAQGYDLAIIDAGCPSSEPEQLVSLHHPRQQSVLVIGSDPGDIKKAYALVKTLHQSAGIRSISVIVNQVTDGREALRAFVALRSVVSQFIDVQLDYLGHCERDEKITQSMMKRKFLLDLYPRAPVTACLELLAKRLQSKEVSA